MRLIKSLILLCLIVLDVFILCGYDQGLLSLGCCKHAWLRTIIPVITGVIILGPFVLKRTRGVTATTVLTYIARPHIYTGQVGMTLDASSQMYIEWGNANILGKRTHLAPAYIDHLFGMDISDEIVPVSNGILISMQELIWRILYVRHATRIRRNTRSDKLHCIKAVEQYMLTWAAIGRTVITVFNGLTRTNV